MTYLESATAICLKLIEKSGVREFDDPQQRINIAVAASEMALTLLENENWSDSDMPATAVGRQQVGTQKTFKSSGGDAAITMTSVANGAARESVKIDMGATIGQLIAVKAEVEIAATPTAGATVDLYWNPSDSATAGTDNCGGCSGTDAAYAGYSSNLVASLKQLVFIGSLVTTAQATATVQKGFVGTFRLPQRYGSLVVVNNSGAAIHSSATNIQFIFTPIEDTSEPS